MIAVYDLEVTPCAYDAAHYVSLASAAFKKSGCHRLLFLIVPDKKGSITGAAEPRYDVENHRWRIRQIVIPCMTAFCPDAAIQWLDQRAYAQKILQDPEALVYPTGYSLDLPITRYSNHEFLKNPIPDFADLEPNRQAIDYARAWITARAQGRRPISITLRQSAYGTDRNSDIASWIQFAAGLDKDIYFPFFIPDTEQAPAPQPSLAEFATCPEASFNLEIRSALYRQAYANLSVSNGPAALSYLNRSTRYLNLKILSKGEHAANLYELAIRGGFRPGRHWPGASPLQRFIWEDDRPELIKRAFAELVVRIENRATNTLETLLSNARAARSEKRVEEAWDWSALAVAFHPENPDTWTLRAEILRETGRNEEAFYLVVEALQIHNHPTLHQIRLEECSHLSCASELATLIENTLASNPEMEDHIRTLFRSENCGSPIILDYDTGNEPNALVFGASLGGKRVAARLAEPVAAFVDNDPSKQGGKFLGRDVISPSQLARYPFSTIWIASHYSLSIYKQLIALGFPIRQIRIAPIDWLVENFNAMPRNE